MREQTLTQLAAEVELLREKLARLQSQEQAAPPVRPASRRRLLKGLAGGLLAAGAGVGALAGSRPAEARLILPAGPTAAIGAIALPNGSLVGPSSPPVGGNYGLVGSQDSFEPSSLPAGKYGVVGLSTAGGGVYGRGGSFGVIAESGATGAPLRLLPLTGLSSGAAADGALAVKNHQLYLGDGTAWNLVGPGGTDVSAVAVLRPSPSIVPGISDPGTYAIVAAGNLVLTKLPGDPQVPATYNGLKIVTALDASGVLKLSFNGYTNPTLFNQNTYIIKVLPYAYISPAGGPPLIIVADFGQYFDDGFTLRFQTYTGGSSGTVATFPLNANQNGIRAMIEVSQYAYPFPASPAPIRR